MEEIQLLKRVKLLLKTINIIPITNPLKYKPRKQKIKVLKKNSTQLNLANLILRKKLNHP